MIKNLLLILSFIILLGSSSNKSIVSNPITGEKKTPGIFLFEVNLLSVFNNTSNN